MYLKVIRKAKDRGEERRLFADDDHEKSDSFRSYTQEYTSRIRIKSIEIFYKQKIRKIRKNSG